MVKKFIKKKKNEKLTLDGFKKIANQIMWSLDLGVHKIVRHHRVNVNTPLSSKDNLQIALTPFRVGSNCLPN